MLVCLHAHVLNIIYTDINQQSTDQQRNMPAQYYSSLKSFITFFYKTNEEMTAAQKAENERKCSLVLKYCETNYRRIGRGEDPNREDEEVQELLRIRPIHIQRWLNQVAYHKEEPGVEDNPTYARSNTTISTQTCTLLLHAP